MNVNRLGVGRRIRSRRAADRRLIDLDHLVDQVDAFDLVVRAGLVGGAIELARQRLVEDVVDQRALARAADAGDGDQPAERNLHVDVLQVVGAGAANDDLALGFLAARLRRLDRAAGRRDTRRSASRGRCRSAPPASPGRSPGRRARRRRGRGRSRSRPCGSSLRRARRRPRCCRDRAAGRASPAACGCRAGAGRSTARRARRARRSGSSRSAWPGGCAALRRPTASPPSAPA